VWLRPLGEDKSAGQGYVAAGKVYCFLAGAWFLGGFLRGPVRGFLGRSTLSAGDSRKGDEKDEARERPPRASRGAETNERSAS